MPQMPQMPQCHGNSQVQGTSGTETRAPLRRWSREIITCADVIQDNDERYSTDEAMGVGVWWNGREIAGNIHAARPTLRTTDDTVLTKTSIV